MASKLPFRLILASGSPARRELLGRAGYEFEVIPPGIEEPAGEGFIDPRHLVHHISWLKAAAVAAKLASGVIIAADTLGWLNGQPIGKPTDRADAGRIIRLLSGTRHELWTGVTLWRRPDDLQITWQEVSIVEMKRLTDAEIEKYLDLRTWEGCSGAYAIEESDDPYVRVVSGSISNVIGLPMERLTGLFEGPLLR
jgi:septum formation protein